MPASGSGRVLSRGIRPRILKPARFGGTVRHRSRLPEPGKDGRLESPPGGSWARPRPSATKSACLATRVRRIRRGPRGKGQGPETRLRGPGASWKRSLRWRSSHAVGPRPGIEAESPASRGASRVSADRASRPPTLAGQPQAAGSESLPIKSPPLPSLAPFPGAGKRLRSPRGGLRSRPPRPANLP